MDLRSSQPPSSRHPSTHNVPVKKRRMAHAKYFALQRAAAPADRAAQQRHGQAAAAGGGGGGWVGWLVGGIRSAAGAAAGAAGGVARAAVGASGGGGASSAAAGTLSAAALDEADMGADEWQKLAELAMQTEEALSSGAQKETPYTVNLRLAAQVATASVELRSEAGAMLLQGALSGVGARVVAYPATTDLRLDITMVRGSGLVKGWGQWGRDPFH